MTKMFRFPASKKSILFNRSEKIDLAKKPRLQSNDCITYSVRQSVLHRVEAAKTGDLAGPAQAAAAAAATAGAGAARRSGSECSWRRR